MIKKAKAELRKKLRAQLSKQEKRSLQEASSIICNRIISTVSLPENIAIFSAHGSEIHLSALHQLAPDKKFLYPLCHPQGVISYHHVTSTDELVPGKHGILEPDPKIHTEVLHANIHVFFCPGLAFGKDGSRLGHGGGYYDRALAEKSTNHHVLVCAIALDEQVFDSVPSESHDIKMDQIITENGSYHCQTC